LLIRHGAFTIMNSFELLF